MENKLKDFLKNLNDEEMEKLIEKLKELKIEPKKTGYERPKMGETSWNIEADGTIAEYTWLEHDLDWDYYNNVNMYSVEEVAKADARADLLMRNLRRYAKLHNKETFDWCNDEQKKWYIRRNGENDNFCTNYATVVQTEGVVYFASREIAENALRIFNSELVWYFREYL